MQEDKREPTEPNDETQPRRELTPALAAHPSLSAQPRHNVRGGTIVDVDPDDGTETFHIGRQKADCPKCPGDAHRWHDFFVEVTGETVIQARVVKLCLDCELETEVSANVQVGTVEAPSHAVQNRQARRAAASRKGRRRKG